MSACAESTAKPAILPFYLYTRAELRAAKTCKSCFASNGMNSTSLMRLLTVKCSEGLVGAQLLTKSICILRRFSLLDFI